MVSRLDQIYKDRLAKQAELKKTYTGLDAQFEKIIGQKNAKGLFERTKKVSGLGALNSLQEEFTLLTTRLSMVSDPRFWISKTEILWQEAQLPAVSFFFVLAIVLIILRRLKKEALGLKNLPVVEKLGAWHQMASDLLSMSIISAGTALTIFLYSRLDRMIPVSNFFGRPPLRS